MLCYIICGTGLHATTYLGHALCAALRYMTKPRTLTSLGVQPTQRGSLA